MDLEETLLEKKAQFKEVSTKVNVMFEKAPEMFQSAYEQLKTEEEKYSGMAEKLKLPFTLSVPRQQCETSLEQISNNISSISEAVTGIMENSDFTSPEQAISLAGQMQRYGESARIIQDDKNVLFDMVKAYSDEALFDIQRGLDERIQTVIRDTKLQLIGIKKQDFQNQRISFFGGLFGTGRLRQIELSNLELEEDILRSSPIKQKTSYNAQDSLADLRAFVIKDLKKQDTNDIKSVFYSAVEVFGLSPEVIDEKAQRKLHSVPMVMSDIKKRNRTSERIKRAEQRKSNLEAELAEVKSSSNRLLDGDTSKPETTAEKFASVLKEAVICTAPDYFDREKAPAEVEKQEQVIQEISVKKDEKSKER